MNPVEKEWMEGREIVKKTKDTNGGKEGNKRSTHKQQM